MASLPLRTSSLGGVGAAAAASPQVQLSAKRKRSPASPEDADSELTPGRAAAPATSSPPSATSSLLVPARSSSMVAVSAPRLRMLSTSTPLLTMPTPSPELLPVLTARAARQPPMPGSEGAPFASGAPLLRSTSAAGGSWPGMSPAAAGAAAAGAAAAAAALSAQTRAVEAAALDRERALRVSVEELRAAVRAKTSDLAESALRAEQRQAQFDQQKAEYEARIEKLQSQMLFIHGEERKEFEKRKERESELDAANEAQMQQLAELHRLRKQLNAASPTRQPRTAAEAAADAAAEVEEQRRVLEKRIKAQSRTILELESQTDTLQQRVDEADQQREQAAQLQAQLEHTQAQLEAAQSTLRTSAAAQEAAEVTAKRTAEFLAAQVHAEALQAENTRLHQQRHNASLAAEQLLSVEAKCARLEAERDAAALVALENEQLKARLLEWEQAVTRLGLDSAPASQQEQEEEDAEMADAGAADAPQVKRRRRVVTPQPFLDSYHQLQATNLTLQARAQQAELQGKLVTKERLASEERVRELSEAVSRQEQAASRTVGELTTLQRQCTLLTKERDGLQKVLDAYDNEQTPLSANRAAAAVEVDSEALEAQVALKTRVRHLETIVKELEQQVRTYQREHGVAPPVHPTSPGEAIPSAVALLSQVGHLEKQHAHLAALAADLTDKVDWVNAHYPHLLDAEHGRLKVIQLPNNPSHARVASKHKAELEAASNEIRVLRLRCEELQQQATGAGGEQAATDAPSASSLLALESAHAARVSALEAEKSQLEKKTLRLKEIFGAKVLEFRNICYLLTGYKIEMIQGNAFRLKSMYAEREADHLLFQQKPPETPGATVTALSVLETEFTKSLDGATTNYLEKFESIPGFLAAVTLQLLEKSTKAVPR